MVIASEQPNIPVILFCGDPVKWSANRSNINWILQLKHLESQGLVKVVYQSPEPEPELDFSRLEDRVMVWFDECHYVVQGVKEVEQKRRAVKPYFRKNERY